MTIPADARPHLGVGEPDTVAFVIEEDGTVQVRPAPFTLESVLGAIRALPDESIDLDREIEADLMRRAARDEVVITTADAVIADVAFILTSKAHDHHRVSDAARRRATSAQIRGLRLRDKGILLHARDVWRTRPSLGCVDALSASYAMLTGRSLATIDRDVASIPNLALRQPD